MHRSTTILLALTGAFAFACAFACAAPAAAAPCVEPAPGVEGRGSGLEVRFAPGTPAPASVTVVRQSAGHRLTSRLVARIRTRERVAVWDGEATEDAAVGDGLYVLRYRVGGAERRLVVHRAHARWNARPAAETTEPCGALRSLRAQRPVFGGADRRGLTVTYRVARPSTVRVEILRAGRVLSRTDGRRAISGPTYTLRLPAEGLAAGEYRIRLSVESGGQTVTSSVVSRRV
jgi:hypothetical protein